MQVEEEVVVEEERKITKGRGGTLLMKMNFANKHRKQRKKKPGGYV